MRIAVMPAGTGRLVEDLRDLGADAIGVDIYLYPVERGNAWLVQADMANTGFEAESLQAIFSEWGPFLYERSHPDVIVDYLREAHRLLGPGGHLMINPADRIIMEAAVSRVPGLELLSLPENWKDPQTVIIRKK